MVLPPANEACAADTTSFAEDVFPIFKGRCVGCHAPGKEGFEKSGLDLTTYEGVMKGTKFGPMVRAEGSGQQQPGVAARLARLAGDAHAARKEEALDLRPQRDPHLDSRGREEQLTLPSVGRRITIIGTMMPPRAPALAAY